MQTITRANRVFPGKNNGLIVAYVDVLSNLHKALAIYASTGALGQTVLPVEEKEALVDALRDAVEEIRALLPGARRRPRPHHHPAPVRVGRGAQGRQRPAHALRRGDVELPGTRDPASSACSRRSFRTSGPTSSPPIRKVIRVVMDRIGDAGGRPEVSGVMAQIEQLLDESVAANAYLIGAEEREALMDLSEVDWDAVKAMFASGRQRTAAQKLRSMLIGPDHQPHATQPHPRRPLSSASSSSSTTTTPAASTSSSTSTSWSS